MNIIYLPLLVYLVSSVLLVILYHKSSIKDKVMLPTISLTGQHILNNDISYYSYLVSFIILSICAFIFYMKCISVPNKKVYSIILLLGITACILNIVQGIYTLDKDRDIHEKTAYGGIFLHLVALSIYLYISKHDKKVTYIVIGSWLSVILHQLFLATFNSHSGVVIYSSNMSLSSVFQRLCVCLLIVTATMISKGNTCFK